MINALVLDKANSKSSFEAYTDDINCGLGRIVCQSDKLHIIAYANRDFKASERHYSWYKLEFLPHKWAVADKYYYYLYGRKFEVYTDRIL